MTGSENQPRLVGIFAKRIASTGPRICATTGDAEHYFCPKWVFRPKQVLGVRRLNR